jgi:hypothetical protein
METPKKFKYLFFVFLALHGALAALMVGSLSTDGWVYSQNHLILFDSGESDKNEYFKGSEFQGSLSFCHEGCYGSYAGLETRWCDKYKEAKTMNDDQEYESVCSMFKHLNFAMLAYALLDVLALIVLLVWFVGIACCLGHSCYFKMNFLSAACTAFIHVVALVAYVGLSNLSFEGGCDENPKNGDLPVLCANHGPRIALVVAIILPFISVAYCIVSCKYQKVMLELKLNENRMRQPIQLVENVPAVLILPQNLQSVPTYFPEPKPDDGQDERSIIYPPAIRNRTEDNEKSVSDNFKEINQVSNHDE